jgi:hypothetical protein
MRIGSVPKRGLGKTLCRTCGSWEFRDIFKGLLWKPELDSLDWLGGAT